MSTYPGPETIMKCPICNKDIVLEIIYGAGASCPPPVAGFKGLHKCPDEIFGTTTIKIFGTAHDYEDLFDNPGIEKPVEEKPAVSVLENCTLRKDSSQRNPVTGACGGMGRDYCPSCEYFEKSKFMKEWEEFLSERKSIRLRVDNDYWEEIRSLARIIDKHLTEMKDDIQRSFMQETLDQRFKRKGGSR